MSVFSLGTCVFLLYRFRTREREKPHHQELDNWYCLVYIHNIRNMRMFVPKECHSKGNMKRGEKHAKFEESRGRKNVACLLRRLSDISSALI